MRNVLLHYHVFKNAGTTIDLILSRNFGAALGQVEGQRPTDILSPSDVLEFVLANPSLKAVTSHQARLPLPEHPTTAFHPILFLRHPIDRIGSIYTYERGLAAPSTPTAKMAQQRDIGAYIEWLLSSESSVMASNFQCAYLSRSTAAERSRGNPTAADLRVAKDRLAALGVFGLVESFDESLAWLHEKLRPTFGHLDLSYAIQNKSPDRGDTLLGRLDALESQLGASLYQRLLEKNALDLDLYQHAALLFGQAAMARARNSTPDDLVALQKENETLRGRLAQHGYELHEIRNSRTWRAALLLQRIRTWFVPVGSLRERGIRRGIGLLRGLKPYILRLPARLARAVQGSRLWAAWRDRHARRALRALAGTARALYAGQANPSPTVSIVIPAHNQLELTLKCLISIARSRTHTAYEIIVLDDASTDGTQKCLESIKGIRYLRNPENLGFLLSCNRAATHARGSYVLFLNNDTLVHPSWLDNLIDTFSTMPGTGVAGAKLVLPGNRLQEAGSLIWADGSATNFGRGDDPEHYRYSYVRESDYVSGACMLVLKSLWEKLGGFDERYRPAYYEDVDFAFRAREAGYKVVYQPFSVITHLEGGSHGTDVSTGVKRYQVENREKFLDRWADTIASHGQPDQTSIPVPARRQPKGKVLYIDDGAPRSDRYAGALLSEFYLTTLNEAGYAITFLPHIDLRYSEEYTSRLQRQGIMCVYQPYVRSSLHYIREQGATFDYVVVSRANVAHEVVEAVKKAAPQARIVFNSIDLHFLRFERAAQLSRKPADLEMAAKAKREELNVIRLADCTLVVTAAEAALLAGLEPAANVKVVPFPADVYAVENGFEDRKEIVFLGGFMHKPNVDAVHFFAKEIWPLLAPRLRDATFVIAGADAPPEIRGLASDRIIVRGHVADLHQLFQGARLSVAPIRFGAGLKGKIITSLGFGVPCVATTIAAEGTGLTAGMDILIADEPEQFADAVAQLYTSPDLWSSLSAQGQHSIQQNYSRPVVAARLLQVFSAL